MSSLVKQENQIKLSKKVFEVVKKLLFNEGYELDEQIYFQQAEQELIEDRLSQNIIVLKGTQINDQKQIVIHFSIGNNELFEKQKMVFEINQKISNYGFILQIKKQILKEEDNICIHIIENYESNLEEELQEMKMKQVEFSEKQIVSIFMDLIYSLIETTSNQFTHGLINPTQIYKMPNGCYKLLNGQNLGIKQLRISINQDDTNNKYYLAPEIIENLNCAQIDQQDQNHIQWQRDVYSMGLCFLRIIQVEINNETISMIQNSSYQKLADKIDPKYKTLFSFITDFMVQYEGSKRDLPYRIRRYLIYFYSDLYIKIEQEVDKIEQHINSYISQNKPQNLYLALQYLVLSQSYLENSQDGIILKSLEIIQNNKLQNEFEESLFYLELGVVQLNSQQYSDSLISFQKSLQFLQQILGDIHILIAYTNSKLALAYFFLQNQVLSFNCDDQALEMRKKLFNGDHSDISDSLSCVGFNYLQKNQYSVALEFSEQSFEMRKRLFCENHPDIASSLEEIGTSYTQLKDHQRAHINYLKALEIRQKIYSENHNEIAKSYDSLAVSYSKLGQEELSLEYDIKALKIRQMIYPKLHPCIARSINNIAISYLKLRDYHKALEYALDSYEIRKQIFPELFPDMADSLSTLGQIYYRLSEYSLSSKCYQKTLSINLQLYSTLHEYIVDAYYNLVLCHRKQGDIKLATKYEYKLLKLREKHLTRYHPDVADSYDRIAELYQFMQNYYLAETYFLQAMVIKKRFLGDSEINDDYINSLINMAQIKIKQEEYDFSKEYFLKAIQSIQINNPSKPRLISILNGLSNLYYLMKDYDFSYIQSRALFKLAQQYPHKNQIPVNMYTINHAIISRKFEKQNK